MRRATTPTHTFTFPDTVKVDGLSEILITYSQAKKTILEKGMSDLTLSAKDNTASLTLTQEETNKFAPSKALIQVRAKGENGVVLASQMLWLDVKPVLNSEAM
jgi:hypothetical protein